MSIYIGDTSEQLGQGLLINGELWTKDSIYELQAQIEVLKHNLEGWQLLHKHQSETIGKYQSKVEQLNHIVDVNKMVLHQYAIYEWREIGETDWSACNEDWFEYCQSSPEHDTRKTVPNIEEIKAQAVKDFIGASCGSDVSIVSNQTMDFAEEYIKQLHQPNKENNQ